MSTSPKFNNLHVREECPLCHYVFIRGYDNSNLKICPSCKSQYSSGKKPSPPSNYPSGTNKCIGSNNVYFKNGCPAIMSDGRFITYYNSTNELTEQMRKLNGIKSSNAFRTFMQNNAEKLMDTERNYINQQNTCSPSTACSEGWYDLWTKNNGNWCNRA